MAIKTQKIVADFETTTDKNDVRVWAVCAVDIDTLETVYLGNDLGKFLEWLSNKNTVCYFHNMKFDLEFILSHILKSGKWKHSNTHEPGTFETLITDDGVFYSCTMYFAKENKKYKKVVFYDSLKKLPFKVSVIAKAFELGYEKLSIDYDAPRPVGHELTQEEKEYIVIDCRIVAQALKIQFEQNLKKMTNASDAMNGYKSIISRDRFERLFPMFPVELDADLRRAYKGGFVYLNPKYRGRRGLQGITLDVNSLYPSVMYYSLLPYGYPVYFEGEPDPDENYPLFIVRLSCEFELKPGHLPTIQLKNNRAFVETEYLKDSNGEIVEMTLTNVDLKLFLEHYETYNLEYICGWKFRGKVGMFKEYIDYWMNIKETTTGALRQLAKLMLNSLYGKFATNPKASKKLPYLGRDGCVRYALPLTDGWWVDKKGVRHDKPPKEHTIYLGEHRTEVYRVPLEGLRDPVYTAMGAFITAYAREKTIRSAQAVYDRFIYADTDSLHLIGQDAPEGLEIHPTHLGAWKNEGIFTDSKYIRAKTYMETMVERKEATLKNYAKALNKGDDLETVRIENGLVYWHETKVTCAGMPDNVKEAVTYDNFRSGSTFDGKLMPRRYPGGIVLENTTFTIK